MHGTSEKSKKQIEWLTVILAVPTIFFLTILYFLIKYHTRDKPQEFTDLSELLLQILPNLISSLTIFFVIYLVFKSHDIFSSKNENLELGQIQETLEVMKKKLEEVNVSQAPSWLVNGYTNYEEVPWQNYLSNSRKIVIVAFYLDKWIISYQRLLKDFLKQDKAEFIIILPDPDDEVLLQRIHELIPIASIETIKKRIRDSVTGLNKLIINNKIDNKKVEIHFYSKVFSYTMQLFDDKLVYISINEMFRDGKYNSPFILLNMTENAQIRDLFNDELNRLKKHSRPVDLRKWN